MFLASFFLRFRYPNLRKIGPQTCPNQSWWPRGTICLVMRASGGAVGAAWGVSGPPYRGRGGGPRVPNCILGGEKEPPQEAPQEPRKNTAGSAGYPGVALFRCSLFSYRCFHIQPVQLTLRCLFEDFGVPHLGPHADNCGKALLPSFDTLPTFSNTT